MVYQPQVRCHTTEKIYSRFIFNIHHCFKTSWNTESLPEVVNSLESYIPVLINQSRVSGSYTYKKKGLSKILGL